MVLIKIMKIYMIILLTLLIIYTIRHIVFTFNRLFGNQKLYYRDIKTSDLKTVSVLVPMYNEEAVARNVLDSLLKCDYDRSKLEIIPINDRSNDGTKGILDEYEKKYPNLIKPLHRKEGLRGKPAGLNEAMAVAEGEIILVFDADYRPDRNLIKQLALAFEDPDVGAVMGRVIPYNANKNLLTRLINMERSGGYQVDQQARYNLNLIAQYGGTVGGFRKDLMLADGGFDTAMLAEDTELTYRFETKGYRVVYANSAEYYEESPETYDVRGRQIRRWARGHNQVMFRYFGKTLRSSHLTLPQKIDGVFLLMVYLMPVLLMIGKVFSLILFFTNEMQFLAGWWVILFLGTYISFGNFAPFYQIGVACFLDDLEGETLLLPFMMFNFYFYMWYISLGFFDAVRDKLTRRDVSWAKTQRFAESDKKEEVGK